MSDPTATIRELRTDFRSIKRKLEQHGEILITDHGEPAYLIKPLPRKMDLPARMPDYLARLLKRQPKPLSSAETLQFWEEERR